MFETYVQSTKPSWKRRSLAIGSIAIHSVALVALVLYAFIHVEEIAPPAIALTFFSAPPPPPPPPPPAKKQHTEHKTVTPTVVPSTIPKLVEPKKEEEKDDDSGQEGGVEGGVAGGVVGGVPNSTNTAAPKMLPMFVVSGNALSKPDPHLPEFFKQAHPGSIVEAKYKLYVNTDGKVYKIDVVNALGGIDDTVAQQIKSTWAFKPQPTPFAVIWIFKFKIN